VSGLLTKPGLAVWSSHPDGEPPLIADLAGPASDATESVAVLAPHDGPVVIAACTITYSGLEPTEIVAIVRTPRGEHLIVKSRDRRLVQRATASSLVGESAEVVGQELVRVRPGSAAPPTA
jgi:hypothetical protein